MKTVTALVISLSVLPAAAGALEMPTTRKGVVRVLVLGKGGLGSGTGFVINDSGHVVTNQHVIANGQEADGVIKILTNDLAEKLKPEVEEKFGRSVPAGQLVSDDLQIEIIRFLLPKLPQATVQWSDEKRDLALLRTQGLTGIAPLPLGRANLVEESQRVFALGYPGVGDRAGVASFLALKVNDGVITSKEFANAMGEPIYQISAQINHGNSGGPLVTDCGEVVGINSFGTAKMEARYAIQIDNILPELDRMSVSYAKAPAACRVGAVSTRDPVVLAGIAGALILGAAALLLVSTQRGRAAVRDISTRSRGARRADVAPRVRTRVVLRGISGPYAGKDLELDERPVAIGRDPSVSHVVFPRTADGVSKRHCILRIDRATGGVVIEDCGSVNGTYLESGVQLQPRQEHRLRSGDRFYVGERQYLFELRVEES